MPCSVKANLIGKYDDIMRANTFFNYFHKTGIAMICARLLAGIQRNLCLTVNSNMLKMMTILLFYSDINFNYYCLKAIELKQISF